MGVGRVRRFAAMVAALALAFVGCSSDDDGDGAGGNGGSGGDAYQVLRVPDDHETIQAAVDAAEPGDLVLISPGVYNEAVDVTTENLTIRGVDRNETILDGEFELDNGIRVVGADGVAIENLTARNYAFNGFYWTGVDGFRGSYLTAYRNGDYGIYGFGSVNGLFEHSFASGSPDAGFYLGQCFPCDTVIDDVISEWNGLGYSGTNSGGGLYIVNSTWRYNRAGVVPNTGSYELCYPQRDTTVVGNTVYGNNNPETPAIDVALLAMGNGILVAGGLDNVVERNLVFDHDVAGIGLVPFPEENPSDDIPEEDPGPCDQAVTEPPNPADLPDLLIWPPENNTVRDNVVSDSGVVDLATADAGASETPDGGNCFAGNTFSTTAPLDLETKAPCGGEPSGDFAEGALDLFALMAGERPPSVDYKVAPIPEPPAQPNMPDAETAPPRPATDVPPPVDLASITVPRRPAGV